MEGVFFLFNKKIEARLTLPSYVLESPSILTVLCIFSLPTQNHRFLTVDVISSSLTYET